MKITKHITFFYIFERIKYINQIINETNNYTHETDIFIHTNDNTINKEIFDTYTNGSIQIIYHDLTHIDPFYLTWKCRDLLKLQKEIYDIFIYIEDDILVPNKAIDYWIKYNEKIIELGYNLGFLRIETLNDEEYTTDLNEGKLNNFIYIEEEKFYINDKNTYCAFWIYNKNEFNKFVNSIYYDINNIPGNGIYGIREKSSIGLHGIYNLWYKNTILPVVENNLNNDCRIYHLPNNYVTDKNSSFAKLRFNDVI